MESILQAHEQLEQRNNLSRALADVQATIQVLQNARDAIVSEPHTTVLTMAKLKQPMKTSFDKLDDDLKEVNKGLNHYQKALDKKSKRSALPIASTEPLAEQPDLIDRAIVMHLLREGKFDVANSLVHDINSKRSTGDEDDEMDTGESVRVDWLKELAATSPTGMSEMPSDPQSRGHLQQKFTEMYHVLDALRNHHDLQPAITWANKHSAELERRGSNLEFELSKLKFIELYTANDSQQGCLNALEYARVVLAPFARRYTQETKSLMGALAYASSLETSPYASLFYNRAAWEEASDSFTREFCGLLGLSEKSPLFTAVTAGGIALPVLEKVERVMAQTRGQWTSVNELPVETPLPYTFKFHSIFVCPVSKEQATDSNPPVMLPCGHVIAQESLEQHSRGKNRMKCPYCPVECAPKDAKRIFI